MARRRLAPALIVPVFVALAVGCDTSQSSPPTGPNPPVNPNPAPVAPTPPASGGGNTGGGGGNTGGGGTSTISFASDVGPIFTQNCAQCHAQGKSQYARAQLCDAQGNPNYSYIQAHIDSIISVIESGQMPPGGGVTDAQVQHLQAWANEGSPDN